MTILVTWLWQGIVLAAVTTASLRWATRLNAATRHVIYWVALTAVLLLPAVSWLTTMAPPAPAILGFAVGPAAALDRAVAPVQIPLPDWTLAIVVGAWMGMLVVGLMRLSVALGALQRLQATSRPLSEQRQRQLPMWSLARGFGRRAELRVSADLRGACAIGLGQPVIVVADTLVDALTDDELDQVVMHEHGHLMRYDDWSSLLQALISSIAGLHPAARWLGTQIDLEREAACDDYVVARTGEVRSVRQLSGDGRCHGAARSAAGSRARPFGDARAIHAAPARAAAARCRPASRREDRATDSSWRGLCVQSRRLRRESRRASGGLSRGGNRHPCERRRQRGAGTA